MRVPSPEVELTEPDIDIAPDTYRSFGRNAVIND